MKRKRILVTGGAGFLGSHLVDRLLTEAHHVTVLDNFFTGERENLAIAQALRIDSLAPSRFELVRGDVCNPFHFEVDEIYHLACPASPVHYQRNPARTIRTAVQGTLNALDCARDVNATVFIASTSEVYGDPEQHPQTEDYVGHVNPIGPRACYDEGKRCAEALAVSYARQYGVRVRIARIFNTYGPRMAENDGRVVSNFICQALRGRALTVYGEGSQTRSFCYVDDLIEAFLRRMACDHADPINIGNPGEFTMLELAEKVRKLTGGAAEIMHEPLPPDDPCRRRPDITKARELLGWEPRIGLDEGLRRTVEYFRRAIGAVPTQHLPPTLASRRL